MSSSSGMVLDVHDDVGGATLRRIYPTLQDVPESVKTAGALDPATLPDHLFALVGRDGEDVVRKYACYDEGNTQLSVAYFLETGHKLPQLAQKTAAANLVEACGWYDIPVPESLEKVALGLGTLMSAATTIPAVTGTAREIKSNLAAVKPAGGQILTPQQMQLMKGAEAVGTELMPLQPPVPSPAAPSKTTIRKTGSEMHNLVNTPHRGEDFGPQEDNRLQGFTKGKQPASNPQMKPFQATVDIGPKAERIRPIHFKEASQYAVGGNQYPLDSYVQVKQASAYFEEYHHAFDPAERHEYAVNLVKRASELGIPVSSRAQELGTTEYAGPVHLKLAEEARKNALPYDSPLVPLLGTVFRKRATVSAELFAATLEEFDKVAGLTQHYGKIPDAYASVFHKEAAESDEDYQETIGNDTVFGRQLLALARTDLTGLAKLFDDELVHAFKKDPVDIFKSLPADTKKVIMRLAAQLS